LLLFEVVDLNSRIMGDAVRNNSSLVAAGDSLGLALLGGKSAVCFCWEKVKIEISQSTKPWEGQHKKKKKI
jgi:hypothetical protein